MQFMILRRSDPQHNSGSRPPPEAVQAMQAFTRMLGEAGVLRGMHTLEPSSSGVRLHVSNGKAIEADDPAGAERELIAGFAVIDVPDRRDALGWMQRWAELDGAADIELELRETGCPGGCAEVKAIPAAGPGRPYVILLRSTPDLEDEVPVAQIMLDTLDVHNAAEAQKGVLIAADGLRSTHTSTRVKRTAGKLALLDGPFTEIKELIAGYWMIRATSLDDAIAWAARNPYPTGPEVDVEIRAVAEQSATAFTDELRDAEQRMRAQQLESGMRAQLAAGTPAWR